jgi:hypothetical protein
VEETLEAPHQRIEVLTEVLCGRRTVANPATVLAIRNDRSIACLAKCGDSGGSALIHKAYGRKSNRSLNAGVREYRTGQNEIWRFGTDPGSRDLDGKTQSSMNGSRSMATNIAGSKIARISTRCGSSSTMLPSKLMQLRFVPSESTNSYFEALRGYLTTQGCPSTRGRSSRCCCAPLVLWCFLPGGWKSDWRRA